MKIFVSKRDRVRNFLRGKEWQSVDEIVLGTGMGRGKTKETLVGLKKELEFLDDKWKIISGIAKGEDGSSDVSPPNEISEEPFSPPKEVVDELPQLEPEPEVQQHGLNAKVDSLAEKLDIVLGVKQTKEKKARLKKFSLAKLKRFNRGNGRAVILMGNDQSMRLIKGEYFEGYKILKVKETYHKAGAIYTWLWEGKQPCYVIPEWSIEPLAAEGLYNEAVANKTIVDPQMATIQAAKMIEQDSSEEGGGKKKMNFMMIIGIVVVGAVVAYILFGGKK